MSLRDIFFKKKDADAQAADADNYARAAAEIDSRLNAFAPRIHDALEDYFARLDAGRAPGWLLRRRMESLFTLSNVDAEAFTPAALDTMASFNWLQEICSGSDIDTAIECRFDQSGKNVLACFRLIPEKPFDESTFDITTSTGKRRTFNFETGQEILPAGVAPPPAPQAEPQVETDGSITVKKPLTLKSKPLFF